ncbi:MAG: carbohydrate kinase [Oscillospiraceae bacterium]|nr:carbohydrate kinase [Oscillospiraceae bacterium]
MKYVVVIDRGSTNTKAVVFNAAGEEVLVSSRASPRPVSPRPGWWEQDMDLVWEAAAGAVRGIFEAGAVPPGDILGVYPVGQGNGLMPIDGGGKPLRMGIHSLDSRAGGILGRWQADGRYARALGTVGLPFSAGSPLPLLCWLRENAPEEFRAIGKALFVKDWIAYKLSGAVGTDFTDASGAGLMDLRRGAYARDVFDLLDAGFIQSKLPEIRRSHRRAGCVTRRAAAETGLPEGTPVLCGAHDIAACAFGAGAADPRQLVCAMGTWGMNLLPAKSLDGLPAALYHIAPGYYLTGAGDGNSGACLDFMLEMLGVPQYERAEAMIAGREPTDIVFHPFLFGAGAGFHGLRDWHGKEDLLLAVYEGIVMGHCLNIGAIPGSGRLECLWIAGGGSKSKVFGQLLADIAGLAVKVPAAGEMTARGGALDALVGLGVFENHARAAIPAPVKALLRPDPRRREFYARKFERFKATIKTNQQQGECP